MNDFIDQRTRQDFEMLSPILPAQEYPYTHVDSYLHGCDLAEMDVRAADYAGLMQRFAKTFRPASNESPATRDEFKLYF